MKNHHKPQGALTARVENMNQYNGKDENRSPYSKWLRCCFFVVEDKVLLVMYDSNIKEVINCLKFKSPKPWQATNMWVIYILYGKNLKRD